MNGSKLHLWKNKRFTHLLAGNFLLWASVFGALVLGVLLISRWYSVQSAYDQFGAVNCSTLKRRTADMENDITSVEFQPDGQIVRSFAVSGRFRGCF